MSTSTDNFSTTVEPSTTPRLPISMSSEDQEILGATQPTQGGENLHSLAQQVQKLQKEKFALQKRLTDELGIVTARDAQAENLFERVLAHVNELEAQYKDLFDQLSAAREELRDHRNDENTASAPLPTSSFEHLKEDLIQLNLRNITLHEEVSRAISTAASLRNRIETERENFACLSSTVEDLHRQWQESSAARRVKAYAEQIRVLQVKLRRVEMQLGQAETKIWSHKIARGEAETDLWIKTAEVLKLKARLARLSSASGEPQDFLTPILYEHDLDIRNAALAQIARIIQEENPVEDLIAQIKDVIAGIREADAEDSDLVVENPTVNKENIDSQPSPILGQHSAGAGISESVSSSRRPFGGFFGNVSSPRLSSSASDTISKKKSRVFSMSLTPKAKHTDNKSRRSSIPAFDSSSSSLVRGLPSARSCNFEPISTNGSDSISVLGVTGGGIPSSPALA